ncbi:uncharacterized protein LOC130980804 [Arachis stenosperma]|uniref:uncharacterized protein LOC130980804 n=1 Tax=Arachis stenosperma TaxID=217475 RepID=UPI0025ACB05E|nr:uncharacterized protein LOC130980804 [Arachis stenosperma]
MDEFYLYFDHPVDEPEIVEDAGNKSNSPITEEVLVDLQSLSSDDRYESTEDEPYKPPPPSADDNGSKRQRVMKGKKKAVSPKKPATKKTGAKRNRKTWKKKGQSSGLGASNVTRRDPQPNRDQNVRFYVSKVQDNDNDPHEFDDDYAFGEGRFELGTRFATVERFKEVVKDSFIVEGRELRWSNNDKERVKTYKNDHTCARDMGSDAADQHWISLKVEKRMSTQPHMRTSEAINFLREEFSLTAHPKIVYRAVREARERIMGNEREQYSNVRDYLFEILRSNPGSRAELCITPIPQSPFVFDKLYICLETCKQSFKSGRRPLIHLDGYFLKTYYGGQLLTAVDQDANNQFHVVSCRVTRSETKES